MTFIFNCQLVSGGEGAALFLGYEGESKYTYLEVVREVVNPLGIQELKGKWEGEGASVIDTGYSYNYLINPPSLVSRLWGGVWPGNEAKTHLPLFPGLLCMSKRSLVPTPVA